MKTHTTLNLILNFFIVIIFITTIFMIFLLSMFYLYPNKYNNYVEKYAKKYNVDANLVRAVAYTESKWNEKAISNKKAKGIMQILPSTAKEIMQVLNINSNNLLNADVNIEIGTYYLNYLFRKFKKEEYVLIAYNAGEGNLDYWLKNLKYNENGKLNIPFPETVRYVKKVLETKKLYKFLDRFR